MKKIAILLVIFCILCLVACRGNEQTPEHATVPYATGEQNTTTGTDQDTTEDDGWMDIIDTYYPDAAVPDGQGTIVGNDSTDPPVTTGPDVPETTDSDEQTTTEDDLTDPPETTSGGINLPPIPG